MAARIGEPLGLTWAGALTRAGAPTRARAGAGRWGRALALGVGLLGLLVSAGAARVALGQDERLPAPIAVPDSAQARGAALADFSLGVVEERNGRFQEALELYERVLAFDPSDPEVRTRVAACLLELRRADEALAMARSVTAADSTQAEALRIEGLILVRLGRDTEALTPLTRASRIGSSTRTLDLLAAVLERLDRNEELLEVLGRLTRINPDAYEMRRLATLERLGRDEEAIRGYREILVDPTREDAAAALIALLARLDRLDEIVDLQQARIAALADNRALRRELVGTLIQAGRFAEAEAQIDTLRALDPQDPIALLQLGLVDYRRGDERAGLRHIDEAWRMAPDSPPIVRWRMRLQVAQEMPDSALASAKHLRDLRPTDPEPMRVMALVYLSKGLRDDARGALTAWAGLSEADPEPLMMLAGIDRAAHAYEPALAAIREAIARAPADTSIVLEFAACLDEAGRTDEAERVVRPLLAARPDDPVILNFYGYLLVERGGDLDEAERLIRRALDAQPDNPAILDSMGWLWYKKGRLSDAETWLRRSLDRGGRHAEIFGHLARVQIEMGKPSDAKKTLRRGLTEAPADSGLLDLQHQLERN
jgi:Flp pilus assembly protein TadD